VRRLRENANDLSGEARIARDKQISAILEDKARDLSELQKIATKRVAVAEEAQRTKQREADDTKREMDDKQKEIDRKRREIEEQQAKIQDLMKRKAELERQVNTNDD